MTATAASPVSLDEVLAYQNPAVVRRYAREHGVSQEEAEDLFQEMLKWLYLCYRTNLDGPDGAACVMTQDIIKIDWMWHTFLLFTRDYAAFCDRCFGFFLHHIPNEDEEEQPLDLAVVREQLEQQYGLVYDVLGEQTLLTWYDEGRYSEGSVRPV